ncbi:MAG: hypothetical protein IJ436_04265 [Bacteroidaceae bacterium]|nr:hypothetical protein [Bacteroidaceae bacterium]
MKHTFFILMLLFSSLAASAQVNYDKYLQEAKRNLQEGNGEKALSCYEVYKTMTGNTNKEFESMLEHYKIVEESVSRVHLLVTDEKIGKQHHATIMKVVRFHKNTPGSRIVVCGFGDLSLPMEYAQMLCERQVKSVTDFLVKNGVARENVAMESRGGTSSGDDDYNILIFVTEE